VTLFCFCLLKIKREEDTYSRKRKY